jgi:hypothetical protein
VTTLERASQFLLAMCPEIAEEVIEATRTDAGFERVKSVIAEDPKTKPLLYAAVAWHLAAALEALAVRADAGVPLVPPPRPPPTSAPSSGADR